MFDNTFDNSFDTFHTSTPTTMTASACDHHFMAMTATEPTFSTSLANSALDLFQNLFGW